MKMIILAAVLAVTGCSNQVRPMYHPKTNHQATCGGTNTPALVGVIGGVLGSAIGYAIGESRAGNCVTDLTTRGYRHGYGTHPNG